MDPKKLLACFDNQGEHLHRLCEDSQGKPIWLNPIAFTYLHEFYARNLQSIIDDIHQDNIPMGICREISLLTNSQQDLKPLFKVELQHFMAKKLGYRSWNYFKTKMLSTGSNLLYGLDFMLLSNQFYYDQSHSKQHVNSMILRFVWLLYSVLVDKKYLYDGALVSKLIRNKELFDQSLVKYYKSYVINQHDQLLIAMVLFAESLLRQIMVIGDKSKNIMEYLTFNLRLLCWIAMMVLFHWALPENVCYYFQTCTTLKLLLFCFYTEAT